MKNHRDRCVPADGAIWRAGQLKKVFLHEIVYIKHSQSFVRYFALDLSPN